MGLTQDLAKIKAAQLSAFFNGAVSNTAVQIKATGPVIVPYLRLLSGATAAFLQIFNLPSASVTVGTTVAIWTIQMTASQDLTLVNGLIETPTLGVLDLGGTGLTIAWTTTATGSAAPANGVSVHALYF
jgi:hypothetical protein